MIGANNDGSDDVFALSKKRHKAHHLVLADDQGQLVHSDTLSAQLHAQHWDADSYSMVTDVVNDAPGLVRMHNALGGIDEYGEVVSPPTLQTNTSDNLTYSVANGVSGITSVTTVPATPTLPPNTNGSSFKALGSSYDIQMPVSGDVSYYQVFEAHTQNVSLPSDSSYQLVYSGSSTVARRTIYTTRYRWYRYKACNSAGCSGLSPYRRVYVYDSAGVPNNFAVSLSPAAVNTNYTLSWTPANGAIDGTVYRLYEIYGQTESLVYSVTRNHWSERLYDYDTSKSIGTQ